MSSSCTSTCEAGTLAHLLRYRDGHTKGNCDADLVLKAMVEYPNYEQAVIVNGDGDFYSLIDHLNRRGS